MEISEGLSQQERLQTLAEKRKKQTEIENKKRQLEDDRRQLQHLKSKALRERWLLDGAPSAGSEQDEAKKQLEEDEAKTRGLEDTIMRMEQELIELETGGSLSATHIKENLQEELHNAVTEVSMEVVHEMNGENDVHQLSSLEVDELIHKADEASMMSQTVVTGVSSVVTVTAGPLDEEAQDAAEPQLTVQQQQQPPKVEISGTEAAVSDGADGPAPPGIEAGAEVGIDEASAENPVTMVFMGYQSVEDEDETKKVLGLEGTVKAELVVIEDGEGGKTPSPVAAATPAAVTPAAVTPEAVESPKEAPQTAPPNGTATATAEPPAKAQETAPAPPQPPVPAAASDGGENEEPEAGGAGELKNKEKQPCKCCTIM